MRASAPSALTISSSLTAAIAPAERRTARTTSRSRVGCDEAMPSATVGVTVTGTDTDWVAEFQPTEIATKDFPEVQVTKVSRGAAFQFVGVPLFLKVRVEQAMNASVGRFLTHKALHFRRQACALVYGQCLEPGPH